MPNAELKSVESAPLEQGTAVLLRLDLNVPCTHGHVESDFRIKRAGKTLLYLREHGCRTVIVSHLDAESGASLEPVCQYLQEKFAISFATDLSEADRMKDQIKDGAFLLVENIRLEKGEVENDPVFAKRLAALGRVYVNDAFAVSHRSHASIVGVPRLLPSFAGFLFLEELTKLTPALNPPKHSLFILGGLKFETKLPLLLKFLDRYEHVFVGGALANDLFKAKGFEVGVSLVSKHAPDLTSIIKKTNLYVPVDVRIKRGEAVVDTTPEALLTNDRIVDVGPKSTGLLEELTSKSKFVLWNGPLGIYQEGFTTGSQQLAQTIAGSAARSVIGGGNTIAAVEKLGLMDKFGFVSTGGGAMLEFLATETLPGLEALKQENEG